MPKFRRAAFFLFSALLFLHFIPTAGAARVSRAALNQVSQAILKSYKLLTEKNDTAAARTECEKAAAIGKTTGDPFIAAMVQVCFGDVADHEEKTDDACRHYAAALTEFKAVPAKHTAHRALATHMNVTQGKRLTLACGT